MIARHEYKCCVLDVMLACAIVVTYSAAFTTDLSSRHPSQSAAAWKAGVYLVFVWQGQDGPASTAADAFAMHG